MDCIQSNVCLWDNCNLRFCDLNSLVYHIEIKHVPENKKKDNRLLKKHFVCLWRECSRNGKEFDARYRLLLHVRTHTNEKPYVCKICKKSFARIENMKIHERVHTGEKPYKCPHKGCSKRYSNSSDRYKHVKTHQEEKPYSCKNCSKSYTDPSSLRKHLKSHKRLLTNSLDVEADNDEDDDEEEDEEDDDKFNKNHTPNLPIFQVDKDSHGAPIPDFSNIPLIKTEVDDE